ncbi:uncharacterized protein LOC141600524 [Silene latifolia]|uniref:uncharacterized protein LOC141600524 n=1 Tax=Silene latifolia TaxID=37657 RepID=UPI003D786068
MGQAELVAGVKEGWGMGIGVVCRDSGANVLWGPSIRRGSIVEPRVAEAEAVLAGIEEVRRRGYKHIEVESGCKSLIDALKIQAKGRSDFHLVLADIYLLYSYFDCIVWSFVSRKFNRVAHDLAHRGSTHPGRKIWVGELPHTIQNDATIDFAL